MTNDERDKIVIRLVTTMEQMSLTLGRILAAGDIANQIAFEAKELFKLVVENQKNERTKR